MRSQLSPILPRPCYACMVTQCSSDDEDEDDFIVDEDEDEVDDEDANSEAEIDSDSASDKGDPLTAEDIDAKITQLKDDKKRARRERIETDDKIKEVSHKIKALEKAREKIDTAMSAICIAGRNNYSKGAIQV